MDEWGIDRGMVELSSNPGRDRYIHLRSNSLEKSMSQIVGLHLEKKCSQSIINAMYSRIIELFLKSKMF